MRYYHMGGPDLRIAPMLAAVARRRLGFITIDADDRADWCIKAATALKAIEATMYGVVSEARAAPYPRTTDAGCSLPPRNREDEMEVVTTACVDRDGNRAKSLKRIERHAEGERAGAVSKLIDLPEIDLGGGDMLRLLERALTWLRGPLGPRPE
jgi:hypothetical protein